MSNTMQNLQQSQFDRAAPVLRGSKVMKAEYSFCYRLMRIKKLKTQKTKLKT